MKHFALVVRTATSKRCHKVSLLRNSDLLHEVWNFVFLWCLTSHLRRLLIASLLLTSRYYPVQKWSWT